MLKERANVKECRKVVARQHFSAFLIHPLFLQPIHLLELPCQVVHEVVGVESLAGDALYEFVGLVDGSELVHGVA